MTTDIKLFNLFRTKFNEEESATIVEEIKEITKDKNLVTKEDLKDAQNKLILWFVGILFLQTGLLITIFALLFKK